jgi:hypothetical protein
MTLILCLPTPTMFCYHVLATKLMTLSTNILTLLSESTSLLQWLQKETSAINSIYSEQVFYNMSLKKTQQGQTL